MKQYPSLLIKLEEQEYKHFKIKLVILFLKKLLTRLGSRSAYANIFRKLENCTFAIIHNVLMDF